MTTTGGRGDVDLTAPVDEHADGDDIEVLPDSPRSTARGRMRAVLVAAIVVVLAAAGIAIAASRHHGGATRVSTASRVGATTTPPAHKHPAVKKTPKPRIIAAPTTAAGVTPSAPLAVVPASPPPVTPATDPVTTVPVEPASVLQWQSTPGALTMKTGGHATFSVTVTNPTDGTVTLGTPLSCPAVLQTHHGDAVAGVMCEQMAQVMAPHQTLTQQYTIYATDTGDSYGQTVAAGSYFARIESLYSVPVTITK